MLAANGSLLADRRSLLIGLLLTAHCPLLAAQSFYEVVYRPPDVNYDVLRTDHFEIIFQRGLDTLALEAALTLEGAYDDIRRDTGFDTEFNMPVVFSDYSDISNGLVSAAPFRQEITATPIKGKVLNPKHSDWLHQVLPHEMVHAVQAEVEAGFGVGTLLNIMSPDLERALNLGIPSGVTEGIAVLYEGAKTRGTGRLNFSMALMKYRAASASGEPWNIGELLDPPAFTWPFDRHYIGGGRLTEFLTDSIRTDFFGRALKFYNRMPFLGFGTALWVATGRPPWELNAEFERVAMEGERERLDRLGPSSDHRILLGREGLACRRPKWIASDRILAHCRGYAHTPGFYTIHAGTGRLEYTYREDITDDFLYSLDREMGTITFSQYHPTGTVPLSSKFKLHVLDLESGRDLVIPKSERCYAAVRLDSVRIWALRDDGQFNEVVEFTVDGASKRIFKQYGTLIKELAVGPEGDVLVLANRSGEQSIHLLARHGEDWFLEPIVASATGSIYDPVWSPDGRNIVFSADPTGVSNIYVYSFSDDRVRKLTNVRFGALEPGVSPDGRRIAFAHYEHEQYQIAVIGLDVHEAETAGGFTRPRRETQASKTVESEERVGMTATTRPYRAFPSALEPRAILPFVRFEEQRLGPFDEELGLGLGLTVLGVDPLQEWLYSVTGFHQASRWWGRASIHTGTNVLRPFIRYLNEPRTATVAESDSTVAEIFYEERSIRFGLSLPYRISSNVHHTSAAFRLNTDYRLIRGITTDSEPLTDYSRRLTLNPAARLAFRLQSNIRDIVPNSGILLATTAEIDAFSSGESRLSRAWRTDIDWFLPLLKHRNVGIRLISGFLWQNRGSILNVDTFLPPGYEDEVFLGSGSFLKAGLDVVQPLAYIDRGLVLLPITIEAVYGFAYGEMLGRPPDFEETYSSVGIGIGAAIRLFHNLRIDARVALSRLIEKDDWRVLIR